MSVIAVIHDPAEFKKIASCMRKQACLQAEVVEGGVLAIAGIGKRSGANL
jgi:hypothetical protein